MTSAALFSRKQRQQAEKLDRLLCRVSGYAPGEVSNFIEAFRLSPSGPFQQFAMKPATAAVAENAEFVAGLNLPDDAGDDGIHGGQILVRNGGCFYCRFYCAFLLGRLSAFCKLIKLPQELEVK